MEYLIRYAPVTLAISYHLAADPGLTDLAIAGILAVMIWMIPFAILPRLRNADMSYWWLIVALIPYLDRLLGIFLLTRPAPLKLETNENGA